MKTQQEIRARFDQVRESGTDFFGFEQEALIQCMEFATANDLVKEGITADDWHEVDVPAGSREYLKFAIGKAVNHRGISAERSVKKLAQFLWVLDDAELAARFDAADYYPYGAPQLAVLEDAWGLDHKHKQALDWLRMRQGLQCEDDCLGGCR